MDISLFRVTFLSEVNIVTRESFLDVEADDREEAEETAIEFLEARGIKVPGIKSVRLLSE